MSQRFGKPFTQQEPIDEATIERVGEILRTGRLHRYNVLEGETSEASLLEQEYAEWQGAPYCLACASGGYALHVALRACGLKQGDHVLTNAYTLAPVPGAIHNAGGRPVLVEIDKNWHIDLGDLEDKAARSGARFLMLSHMRGHISDMDGIVAICEKFGMRLIEDCAHTMGARWKGTRSGNFGSVAAFSAQTYKHINSGEGGLLTTDDPLVAARAIVHSGSYMLYASHGAAPSQDYFDQIKLETPNYSGRMDNVRAALMRGQLAGLDERVERWNRLYGVLDQCLRRSPSIFTAERKQHEAFVGSSIQFRPKLDGKDQFDRLVSGCAERGVDIKWFGAEEPKAFTSRYDSWRYIDDIPHLPRTLDVLSQTCDMRIPLTFDDSDCTLIGNIVAEEVERLVS